LSEDQLYDELDLDSLTDEGPTDVADSDDKSSDYYFDDIFDDMSYDDSSDKLEDYSDLDVVNSSILSDFDIYEELFA
jgi:hypothetical protein